MKPKLLKVNNILTFNYTETGRWESKGKLIIEGWEYNTSPFYDSFSLRHHHEKKNKRGKRRFEVMPKKRICFSCGEKCPEHILRMFEAKYLADKVKADL